MRFQAVIIIAVRVLEKFASFESECDWLLSKYFLLFPSVNTRVMIGQSSTPSFTVLPAKLKKENLKDQ